MKTIGYIIKSVREYHREKAGKLANAIDISQSYLSEIENGHKMPSLELLEKIANHYSLYAWSLLRLEQAWHEGIELQPERSKIPEIHKWLYQNA